VQGSLPAESVDEAALGCAVGLHQLLRLEMDLESRGQFGSLVVVIEPTTAYRVWEAARNGPVAYKTYVRSKVTVWKLTLITGSLLIGL
jgi:hypothetical protein